MIKTKINSKFRGKLRGHVRVTAVMKNGTRHPLIGRKNQITNYGEGDGMRGMLARDLEAMLWTIATGTGGDNEITPPHNPTGSRVPPDPNETEMRVLVEELPIQAIKQNIDGTITYMTLAQREQSNSPDINEFGLLTKRGDLFAHFITEDDGGGNARTFPKTDLMYWIIEWTLEYTPA